MTRVLDTTRVFLLGFVVYFGLAVASVWLARLSHNVAVFWPANAVLVAMALTMSRNSFPALLVSGITANAATQLVFGDSWQLAVGFPLANALEMLVVYFGFQLFRFRKQGLETPQRGLLLLAIVAFGALPAAAIGSLTVASVFGGAFNEAFIHWWAGDIVSSMTVFLPAFSYRLYRQRGGRSNRWLHKDKFLQLAIIVLASVLGFYLLLALHLPPAVVVLFPTLWLALKGRSFGVALISSILTLATSAVVVTGYVPTIAEDLPLHEAVFQQQSLALFFAFPTFLIAVAIGNLGSTQKDLAARNEVLYLTLSNMNQGVSVFDQEANLVLWNDNYLQAFEMTESDVERGTPFISLLELQRTNGNFEGDAEAVQAMLLDRVSRGEEVFAETALNSGRYIKSVHSPTPVGGWIGTHEDVTEVRLLEQRLAHESLHDVLTAVPNRRYFERELTKRLGKAHEEKSPLALFTIDLDKFKLINDTYGHDVGDEVLLWAASTINDAAKEGDFVARMGGDEFMLIAAGDISLAKIDKVSSKLCEALGRTMQIQGNMCVCHASIGVAFSKDGQIRRHDLLTQSDIALYAAKQAGRGTYRLYDFTTGQYKSSLKAG